MLHFGDDPGYHQSVVAGGRAFRTWLAEPTATSFRSISANAWLWRRPKKGQAPFGAAERPLHGIALGRKSWLFAGSDRGGQRAAAMYSLIVTAKLNSVDAREKLG